MSIPEIIVEDDNSGSPGRVDEINYRCEAKETKLHFKFYLSDDERKELIGTQGIGEAGCLLFEYYLRLAAKEQPEISDAGASWHFGWKQQKAQRLRLALFRAGWFRQVRSSYTDGRKGITYYVGKKAVQASLTGKKPSRTKVPPAMSKSPVKTSTPRPTKSVFTAP